MEMISSDMCFADLMSLNIIILICMTPIEIAEGIYTPFALFHVFAGNNQCGTCMYDRYSSK